MSQKIITLAQFKKLYHERVAKKEMSKTERQEAFDEMWKSLPDYVEGGQNGVVRSTKKEDEKAKKE